MLRYLFGIKRYMDARNKRSNWTELSSRPSRDAIHFVVMLCMLDVVDDDLCSIVHYKFQFYERSFV